jgi:hypothetical protein
VVIRLPGRTTPGHGPWWAWWAWWSADDADDADDAWAWRPWHGSWRSRTGAVGSSVPAPASISAFASVPATAPGPVARGSGAAADGAPFSRPTPGNTLRLGRHALH